MALQINSSPVFSNLAAIKYRFLLFIHLILVAHPITLTISQTPQGQPRGSPQLKMRTPAVLTGLMASRSHTATRPSAAPEPPCNDRGGMTRRETWYAPFQNLSLSQQTAETPITHATTK